MPEIKMNSGPGISTTLFINNSWLRIRKMENASNTIFWSACFDRHFTRPKIEMAEKKSPTNIAIRLVFSQVRAGEDSPSPLYPKIHRATADSNRKNTSPDRVIVTALREKYPDPSIA